MDRDVIDTPLSWAIANGNAATVAVTDSLPAIGLGDLGPLQSRTFTWYIDYPYPFLLDMGVYLVAAREPAEYYLSITLSKPPLGESRVLTSAATVVTPAVRAWDGRSDNGAPSADAAWQTATNWAGDAAIQPGDALLFLAGAERLSNTNNFPAGTEFHSLAFPGGGYVIGGAQVGLSAGVVNKATASADNVLDLGIRLDAPQTFQNLSGSTLAVNGPIDTSGNALTIDGPGPVRLGGAISGQGALAKKGAGTTTLSGSNTYAGGTIVAEGTLEVETADALPAGGNLTIGAGATVALAGGLNASAASMAAATAIVGSREKAITLAEAVPASVRRATSAGAPALAVSPGTTIQRESLLAVAEEFQPAAWATRANISQLPARGSAAVVPQVPSRAAAIRDPAPSLPIAPSVQVKAHDAVLRSPALRPWDDAAWAWALDGAPDRRQASKKNVGPAAFAADQALALFLR
jgi:autotransporter-associated beta strand protein